MSELERGRECHRRRAWASAYEALSTVDAKEPLSADDLELLATSAYLIGRDDEYLAALERAHLSHLASGEECRSVRCLFWLGFRLALRGDMGRATGWFARAQRLLAGRELDSVETGYLLIPVIEQQLDSGDVSDALDSISRALGLGESFGDLELVTLVRHQEGRARLRQGRLDEGLTLLDEVMVTVLAGQLSSISTGLLYCSVIDSCQEVYALERASEWTGALTRFCEQQPDMVSFRGACSVHRVELLEISGEWEDAIQQARAACSTACSDPRSVAAAFCRLGDLHRLRGELDEAEAAYLEASRRGSEPHAGLALLRLAQKKPDAALTGIRRALKAAEGRLARAKLLPDYVDVLLANDDLEESKQVCDELDQLACELGSPVLRGIVARAHAAHDLAAGNPEGALVWLHRATQAWRGLDAPYWFARLRCAMSEAYRALGDEEGTRLELDAARVAFERLGALPDLERVRRLARSGPRDACGLTERELEVLRGVAAGKSNKTMASELGLSERTIDRHVSNIFSKLDVRTRAAATARAYQEALL